MIDERTLPSLQNTSNNTSKVFLIRDVREWQKQAVSERGCEPKLSVVITCLLNVIFFKYLNLRKYFNECKKKKSVLVIERVQKLYSTLIFNR